MRSTTTPFSRTDLITLERLRLRGEVRAIFLSDAARPEWVKRLESPYQGWNEEPDEPSQTELIVLLGDAHQRCFHFSAIGLAIGYELCRCGHSWGTNDNHSEGRNVYAQMIFAGAFEKNLPVARLFLDAGPGQIVKAQGQPHDLTSDNLILIPGPRAKREARMVAMEEAERLARERPERLPVGVTAEAYLGNINRLFAEIDRRLGEEA